MKKDVEETFLTILAIIMICAFIFGLPVVWWFIIPSPFWKGFLIGAHITLIASWLLFD